MRIEFVLIISVVVMSFYISVILYILSLPGYAKDVDTDPKADNAGDYLNMVYKNATETKVDPKDLNFFWNNIPDDLKKEIPVAYNLSFDWPPPLGSRAKLTAFPYPKGGGSTWLSNFITGVSSLLDNTSNSETFPGWLVSIYDPDKPNKNAYGQWLNKQIPWDADTGPVANQKSVKMEVTHACYPPPNYEYPTCDDGGYWLYMTPGSGVFWDPGPRCLVATNKIDAMFKMLETDLGQEYMKKLGEPTALSFLTNKLKGTGGGLSLISAMQKVIDAMQNKVQVPTITAFRSMEKSKSFGSWYGWIYYTMVVVLTMVALLVYITLSIVKSFKGKRNGFVTLGILLGSVAAVFGMLLVWYFVVSDGMLTGFGYMTLDLALKKSGLTLPAFITSSRNGNNLLTNSLGMIQNFDFHIEALAGSLGLDSIIFHTQPNKSGSWAVEIIDVRNTPFKPGTKSAEDLIYKLGICGRPLDGSVDNMPPFMQGPLKSAPETYLGFQPTKSCTCNEQQVRQTYDKTGKLKLCVFCEDEDGWNPLSNQMC
jgi:hypothetical protein